MKLSLFVSLACLWLSSYTLGIGGDMGGADPNGSPEKPYLIEDLADFDTFADPANAATYWAAGVHTQLTTNIDLSGRTYTIAVIAPDTSADWGFQGVPFTGSFVGCNFYISNLTINSSGTNNDYLGLFGQSEYGSMITNLRIENVNVTGSASGDNESHNTGGLIGSNGNNDRAGTIKNCYITGSVKGDRDVGGLCGRNFGANYIGGTILSCDVMVNVSGQLSVGGLCGYNSGTISNSSASGIVNGNSSVGGLCGTNYGTVTHCIAKSDVVGGEGSARLGGLCGNNGRGPGLIYESCATGNVISGDNSGGLGGFCGDSWGYDNLIQNCYSTGAVTSGNNSSYLGGFCGLNHTGSDVYNCFSTGNVDGGNSSTDLAGFCSNEDISGSSVNGSYFLNPAGPDNGYGTPLTEAQMMIQANFTGWDFTTPVWMMLREGEDTPRLAWQEVFDGDIAGLYGADMVDFAYLANYWGLDCNSNDCGRADIDDSGDVDIGDLVYVAEDWLK